MVHNALSGQATWIVAEAIVLALSVGCTAQDISSKGISSQGVRRPVWKGESIDGLYENSVAASIEKDGGNVVVTCTLPTIQDGSLRFEVDQISLCDADQNEIAVVTENPTLTITLPERQLGRLFVKVLYMDERSFNESGADPSLLPDWSVRMKTFRLIDVLIAP